MLMELNHSKPTMKKKKIIEEPTNVDIQTNKDEEIKNKILTNGFYYGKNDKKYLTLEGWMCIGEGNISSIDCDRNYFPIIVQDKLLGFISTAQISRMSSLNCVSAVGFCAIEEYKEVYSVISMSQTRAVLKALRIAFGIQAKLLGFESTPAEEMYNVESISKHTQSIWGGKLKELLELYWDSHDNELLSKSLKIITKYKDFEGTDNFDSVSEKQANLLINKLKNAINSGNPLVELVELVGAHT